MWEYEPGVVYENLVRMVKYRGAKLTGTALDPGQVQLRMNQHGYATIVATREASPTDPRGPANIHILLIAPGSDYANKSPKFKNLLSAVPLVANLEVIVVSSDGITPHIKKVIEHYNAEPPVAGAHVYEYDYKWFVIETPKHNSCEQHELVPTDEVEALCHRMYMSKEDYAKITTSDAMAVWLGLRPGMVVKVTRASKTAGISENYRICVK